MVMTCHFPVLSQSSLFMAFKSISYGVGRLDFPLNRGTLYRNPQLIGAVILRISMGTANHVLIFLPSKQEQERSNNNDHDDSPNRFQYRQEDSGEQRRWTAQRYRCCWR